MQVQEGEGWRLVVDPARQPFPVLVGGSLWAAELSGPEARALRVGIAHLLEQHRSLGDVLLEEEAITLEYEIGLEPQGRLWLELEGDRCRWALRFVLDPAPGCRALEAGWTEAAAAAFAAALLQADGLASSAVAADETQRNGAADQHC